MLEVLLSQHVCIFLSPLSQLSDVLAHLLPSLSRYITDVPTRQKHPTAAPCLPENLVELFNQYPSIQDPRIHTGSLSLHCLSPTLRKPSQCSLVLPAVTLITSISYFLCLYLYQPTPCPISPDKTSDFNQMAEQTIQCHPGPFLASPQDLLSTHSDLKEYLTAHHD